MLSRIREVKICLLAKIGAEWKTFWIELVNFSGESGSLRVHCSFEEEEKKSNTTIQIVLQTMEKKSGHSGDEAFRQFSILLSTTNKKKKKPISLPSNKTVMKITHDDAIKL